MKTIIVKCKRAIRHFSPYQCDSVELFSVNYAIYPSAIKNNITYFVQKTILIIKKKI